MAQRPTADTMAGQRIRRGPAWHRAVRQGQSQSGPAPLAAVRRKLASHYRNYLASWFVRDDRPSAAEVALLVPLALLPPGNIYRDHAIECLEAVQHPWRIACVSESVSGLQAAVFAGMEGTRPVLVEIQALVAPSTLGTPRRAVIGWDSARLSMVLAVLEAHCGVKLGQHDVYLNVAGGYRISEPAADLAVAAALVSSLCGVSLPDQSVYFGEISLSGATRPVSHGPSRLKEAEKLGFGRAILPKGSAAPKSKKDQAKIEANLELVEISELADLVARILAKAGKAKNPHNPEDRE